MNQELELRLFGILKEIKKYAEKKDKKKVSNLSNKFNGAIDNPHLMSTYLYLKMDRCRQSYVLAVRETFKDMYDKFMMDADKTYSEIKKKIKGEKVNGN